MWLRAAVEAERPDRSNVNAKIRARSSSSALDLLYPERNSQTTGPGSTRVTDKTDKTPGRSGRFVAEATSGASGSLGAGRGAIGDSRRLGAEG